MIGDRLPRQKPRQVIRASALNRTTRMAESLARTRLGSPQMQVDGIPLMLAAAAANGLDLGKATATIPALSGTTLGSAAGDVSLYTVKADGTITDTTRTITAYNWTGSPVSSGTFVLLAQIGGLYLIIPAGGGGGRTWRWATLPTTAIAAGNSGTIRYIVGGTTDTAKNKWATATPTGGKRCIVDTDESGDLVIVLWDC